MASLRLVLFTGSALLTAALAAGKPLFERDILPLFEASCISCHGPELQESRLRLDSQDAVLRGGLSGAAVIPNDGESSPLLRRLLALDQPSMPFGADPLPAEAIALVREWIETLDLAPAETAPATKHWAYVRPRRPAPPEVRNPAWIRNPVDRFVLARLEAEGLSPSAEAAKETWIRRLSLDLIGLPPALEEVDAFLSDESPDAYENVVDRLLASPHYGERWARPWLDLARRLVERGVRFVQLYHWGWDTHGTSSQDDIATALPARCEETDRASAALVRDLRERGLLDETLVVWGGEFGRTPMNEGRNRSKFIGRDHHPRAFSVWLAGGGIKGGITVGATDELGYNIVEDPIDVHDLHATALHLLGLDHQKLTYRFQGRDFRLTGVSGRVVTKLLA